MSKELTSDLFQKAKDQVAKKNGFDSWKNLRFNAENFQGLDEIRSYNFYLEEAAELYASLQNAELIKERDELIKEIREMNGRLESFTYWQTHYGCLHMKQTKQAWMAVGKQTAVFESLIEKYTDKK